MRPCQRITSLTAHVVFHFALVYTLYRCDVDLVAELPKPESDESVRKAQGAAVACWDSVQTRSVSPSLSCRNIGTGNLMDSFAVNQGRKALLIAPVLGWVEDSVIRSDNPDVGVAESFSRCADTWLPSTSTEPSAYTSFGLRMGIAVIYVS